MKASRLHIALLLLLVPCALLRAQWYDSYEKGREEVRKGQWQQAVRHLSDAVNDEPDSKARKKTYGLTFIDYFPYLYRGIAYYRLNDIASARTDLEKADHEGVIRDANEDGDAPALLTEYLGYIQKRPVQAAEQKPPAQPEQKSPQVAEQKPPAKPPATGQPAEQKKSDAQAAAKAKKESVEKAFASGESYFKNDELDLAAEQFKSVLALEPSHRRAADYLKRIDARKLKLAEAARTPAKENPPAVKEPAKEPGAPAADTTGSALFREARALLEAGNVGRAKSLFLKVQAVAPAYPELAASLAQIASVEEKVRTGIAAYFRGEYTTAIEQLGASSRNGIDNPHVYAFLACSYAAEYLLAGSENGKLKKEAAEAFGRVKGIDPRYELDRSLISPGIIAVLGGE